MRAIRREGHPDSHVGVVVVEGDDRSAVRLGNDGGHEHVAGEPGVAGRCQPLPRGAVQLVGVADAAGIDHPHAWRIGLYRRIAAARVHARERHQREGGAGGAGR